MLTFNYLPYKDDELLVSWFYRLAKANCHSFKDYYTKIFGYDNKKLASYDIEKSFIRFSKYFNSEFKCVNPIEAYLDTSLFPLFAICMTKEMQTMTGCNVFMQNDIVYYKRKFFEGIKVCPDCLKEDRLNNTNVDQYLGVGDVSYIHRSHNVLGVTVCHKHGTRLLEDITKKKDFRFKENSSFDIANDEFKAIETDIDNDLALVYAKTVKILLDARLNIDFDTLKNFLERKVKEKGYNDLYDRNLLNDYNKSCYFKFCDSVNIIENLFTQKYSKWYYPDIKLLLSFILFIYSGIIENFIKDIVDCYPDAKDSIFKEYECKNCGNKYITTIWGYKNGIRCEYCLKSGHYESDFLSLKNSFYAPIIKKIAGKEYSLKKDKVYHNVCGNCLKVSNDSYNDSARAFVFFRKRCSLCNSKKIQRRNEVFANIGNEYELLAENEESQSYTVKHKKCNQVFTINAGYFRIKPHCKFCDKMNKFDDKLIEKIKRLVGEEYSFLGRIDKKVKYIKLRHNLCGKEFVIHERSFMNGGRCSCIEKINRNALKKLVERFTSGHYSLLDNDAMTYYASQRKGKNIRCLLKDNFNSSVIDLRNVTFLKQELLRYSASDILVLTEQEEKVRRELIEKKQFCCSIKELFYDYLCKHYKRNEIIYLDDIKVDFGFEVKYEYYTIMQKLISDNRIVKLYDGLYIFKDNIKKYDAKDVVEALFVNRNDKIVGRWVDAESRREWDGILESTLSNSKTWHPFSVFGKKFKVRNCVM